MRVGALAPGGAPLARPAAPGTTPTGSGQPAQPRPPPGGRAAAANGNTDPSKPMRSDETLLTGDTAAKVTAAAQAKEPGATIERVETDSDGVYEAHMVRADGTHITVQVDASFAVTGVQEGGAGGGGGGRMGGDHDGDGPQAPSGEPRQSGEPSRSGESEQPGQPSQSPTGTSSSATTSTA